MYADVCIADPSPSRVLTLAIEGENFRVLIPPFFTGYLGPVAVYLKLNGFFLTMDVDYPFLATLSLSDISSPVVIPPSLILC